MKIETLLMKGLGVDIPAIKITLSDDFPNVLVIHGFGGNKEEQLGLSWRISNLGYNTFTIDLRGHGENTLPFSPKIEEDIDSLVNTLHKPLIVIGHSLGGRLALLTKANFRIGLSPALSQSFSEQTKTLIHNMRHYRVFEDSPKVLFDILKNLPLIDSGFTHHDLIIYGSRDIPEIKQYCEKLSESYDTIVSIENALHSDIFLLEKTFSIIENYLKKIKQNNIA